MIFRTTPAIFFLLHLIILQSAFGQDQNRIPNYIRQKFQNYCKSLPWEEVFIHTDREEYIAGEDIWFKIYLIDRQSFKPSSNSKIVYVEILNPENKPVLQKRILIDKGFGPGQVVLPDTLSSGTYILRAYTNWMKNFLPYNCFLKDINVYNSLKTNVFRRSLRPINIEETAGDILPVNSGLNLKVNNFKQDSLEIFIYSDEKFRTENKNQIYLFIQTHGIINHLSTRKLTEETTRIAIPKNTLTPGINQITIFDSKGAVCDRLIYTPSEGKQVLTLNSIDRCGTRSKIYLEIELENELSTTLDETNLSISVAPRTNIPAIMELNDYMIFGTEFGLLPWSVMKDRNINEIPPEVMDSLLLTLKSNWIKWKSIFFVDPPQFKYKTEKEDHFLSGKLFISEQQPAGSNQFILMSTPGKLPVFQYARTDSAGDFNFYIPIDEEFKDLLIQPDNIIKDHIIHIKSSFSDQYLQSEKAVDSTGQSVPSYISRWIVNYQIKRIYGSSYISENPTPIVSTLKTKRFYGKPDAEIIMRDYVKLSSMEEVFFEIVPFFALKKTKSGYEVSLEDPYGKKIYDIPPVLMIDGVIIKDASIIANLDPELVEKIDVRKEVVVIGDYLFYGIVNIITKAGNFNYITLPDYAIRLRYRIADPVETFVSPDYSSTEQKNNRVPDFRNTLYWNPSVRPDKSGKTIIEFWTSDYKTDYEINIQGMTPEGKSISLKKVIKVE